MSKSFKIVLIVLLSLLLISFSGLFVILLTNNSMKNFSFSLDFGEEQNLVFDKEYNNDFSNIKVKSNVSDIKFIKTDDSKFTVKVYAKTDENLSVNESSNELTINYEQKNKVRVLEINKSPRIEVYVPSNYSGKFDVVSDVGDVKADSFTNSELTVKINTGDIKVGSVKSVDAVTNTGDIKINNANKVNLVATTGDIKVGKVNDAVLKTRTGDIKVDNISEYILASANTGDILINSLSIVKDSSLTSNTGDIKINSSNEIYFDAKTNIGDTKINNNYRDAKSVLKVKTNTGDITVNN